MLDPSLHVTTVVSGLNQPTSMAFLGPNDFLVLEKATGKVQHVVNGAIVGTALDLAVNSASERGLLGIALQPNFATTHGVYLYWTQSSTGADSANLADVPVLGNRVDRYVWDPVTQTLTFDKNIIMLRSFQADAGQPMRGNHDAGKILFGPDGKLYFQIGDQGRRGQLQNLADGPFSPGQSDDQFGGPQPDDAHVTGVIFRLNADGTTPVDNPFFKVGAQMGGNVGANIQKIFSYGRRNGFGLAFDPITGSLWESENGDDAFDEMNRITAGSNGGWIQIMGPVNRIDEFKEIEATFTPLQGNLPVNGNLPFSPIDPTTFIPALQQVRWPPSLIANSPGQALQRLFVLPGSHYEDPEFSWKWAVAPAAIGFAGAGLGPQHANDLFVGAARTFLDGGYLFEFKFNPSRQHFAFSDPGLKDKVDDNHYKFDEGQSTSLVAGKNFGIVTNIVTGPDGNLYVTSLSNGVVYMISRLPATLHGSKSKDQGSIRDTINRLVVASSQQVGDNEASGMGAITTNFLRGLAAAMANNASAGLGDGNQSSFLIEQLNGPNGSMLSRSTLPNESFPSDVSATASNNSLATRLDNGPLNALGEHWDGTKSGMLFSNAFAGVNLDQEDVSADSITNA
jgi:glucose/arabinose dehydrogenase